MCEAEMTVWGMYAAIILSLIFMFVTEELL